MSEDRIFDLRSGKVGGCTSDPVIKLMKLISEKLDYFEIVFYRDVLPPDVLRVILKKKGYTLEVLKELEDNAILARVKKSTNS
ncbi:MAG: hypothetical protein QXV93_04625 [Zestosphaera sp.]